MILPTTESDTIEGFPSTEEEPGCSPRINFLGRFHDAPNDRWHTGWKPALEPWERHPANLTDKTDCMRGGSFGNAVVISSLRESDVGECFHHGVAMQSGGGSDGEIPRGIQVAISASRPILELEDDWDGQGSPRYSEATWRRATEFLLRQANFARVSLAQELPVPKILPGPNASIDLHWKLADFELLLNIPSDAAQPATFYGDDYRNSCIRGTLDPSEEIRGLVVWLLT
jgi:hypothetical protein